jgi:hypothetical protein
MQYIQAYVNADDEISENNAIDLQIASDYIAEINSEPYYVELLSTIRQYHEYCCIHKSDNDKPEYRFILEFL